MPADEALAAKCEKRSPQPRALRFSHWYVRRECERTSWNYLTRLWRGQITICQ